MNRRSFLRSMRTATIGGAALAVGLPALPVQAQPYKVYYHKPARRWNNCPAKLTFKAGTVYRYDWAQQCMVIDSPGQPTKYLRNMLRGRYGAGLRTPERKWFTLKGHTHND